MLKLAVMKVKLPKGKVWPKWERILSRGFVPRLKDGSATIFLVIWFDPVILHLLLCGHSKSHFGGFVRVLEQSESIPS